MQVIKCRDLIGVPFVDGGRTPEEGFDCWGLARYVYQRAGIELPDYKISCEDSSRINAKIEDQKPLWREVTIAELTVPAIVVMRFNCILCNHTGVYIDNIEGKFIHTAEKIGVHIDRINSIHWRHRIEGFYVPR